MQVSQVQHSSVQRIGSILSWKLFCTIGGFLILLVLSALLVLNGADLWRRASVLLGANSISVDSTVKSFGARAPGEPIEVNFTLTNRGRSPVRIVGCRASCQCAVPNDLPFTVNPDEIRTFPIRITNLKSRAADTAQKVNLEITLFTTDPSQVQIPLTVLGELTSTPSRSVSGH